MNDTNIMHARLSIYYSIYSVCVYLNCHIPSKEGLAKHPTFQSKPCFLVAALVAAFDTVCFSRFFADLRFFDGFSETRCSSKSMFSVPTPVLFFHSLLLSPWYSLHKIVVGRFSHHWTTSHHLDVALFQFHATTDKRKMVDDSISHECTQWLINSIIVVDNSPSNPQ